MENYLFSNEYFQNNDAIVYTCGYEECTPKHSYGPVVRSGYLIHYVVSGKGIYQCGGKLYRLKAGDAFLISPDDVVYYEADEKHPWIYTWIGFHGVKVREYLSRTTLLDTPVFRYDKDDRIRLCHEKMYEASRHSSNKDIIMTSILYEYLFLLAEKFPAAGERSGAENQLVYIKKALEFIQNHYGENISIQEIADHLHLSRTYLHYLFKKAVGTSVKEYLTDIRLKKACDYLKNSDYTVSVIARSVGYSDPLYFSKLFHEKMGMTPTKYRGGT